MRWFFIWGKFKMNKKVIVTVTPGDILPSVPPTLEIRAKKFFNEVGVGQITMCKKGNTVHSFLYGPHNEAHLVTKIPKYKPGGAVAKGFREALQHGADLFDGPFHVRHNIHKWSKYITLSIIEEEWASKANGIEVGRIRTLMEMRDVTSYDLSARTAQLRGMFIEDSINKPSTRYPKNHNVT